MSDPHVVTIYHPGGAQFRNRLVPTQSLAYTTGVIEDDWTHTKDGKCEDLDALELTPIAGKDPDGCSRYICVDENGCLKVTVIGEDGEGNEISLEDLLTASGLKVVNTEGEDLLLRILAELVKQNIHLESLTDERILDINLPLQAVK